MTKHSRLRDFGNHPALSWRTKLMISISALGVLACCVLGIILVASDLSRASGSSSVIVERDSSPNMVEVLVPLNQVEPGMAFEPTLVRKELRPAVGIPARPVRDLEELKGQYARVLLLPGQILQKEHLTAVKPTNTLTASIPNGYRAVTINVDVRSSVEGWARPGARVDVCWATQLRGKPAMSVIVENVKILSVERQMDNNPRQNAPVPGTVTLLATVDEAAKIQLASTTGALNLSLRGDNDRGTSSGIGNITIDDLLGAPRMQGEIRSDSVVRIRNHDGTVEEWALHKGKLVPTENVM